MKSEAWIELIVGTVLLGGLGFLIIKVMDINGTLGGVEAKVSYTSDRLERIAQALPDVGVRIASEEVNRPIRTIVVASTPTRNRDGQYQVVLQIVDAEKSTKWSVPVKLASKSDKQLLGTLAWTGFNLDPNYATFARMQSYARAAALDSSLPATVDTRVSFVLGTTSAEEYLSEISWLARNPKRSSVTIKLDSWKDISAALNDKEGALILQ